MLWQYSTVFWTHFNLYVCNTHLCWWIVGENTSCFFFNIYLFVFTERRREGRREGEKHQYVVDSHAPPAGDLTGNQTRNTGSHPTEPHQPGLMSFLKILLSYRCTTFYIFFSFLFQNGNCFKNRLLFIYVIYVIYFLPSFLYILWFAYNFYFHINLCCLIFINISCYCIWILIST